MDGVCASRCSPPCCSRRRARPRRRMSWPAATATGAASSRSPTSLAPSRRSTAPRAPRTRASRSRGAATSGPPTTSARPQRVDARAVQGRLRLRERPADRFAAWKDALQADISLISRFMGAQSGGRKAPRFDMGTNCGPDYVDIQVVALPGARATYANNLGALKAAVAAQVPAVLGQPRNTLVLADRMSTYPAGYWTGIGELRVRGDGQRQPAQRRRAVRGAVGARRRGRAGRGPRRLVGGGPAARALAQPRRGRGRRRRTRAATATASTATTSCATTTIPPRRR